MNVSQCIRCVNFPCQDVNHHNYILPDCELDPAAIKIILISEAAPANLSDYYYAGGSSHFEATTVLAFNDAGANVQSIQDILKLGVYLTTAVKCGKTGYAVASKTIEECSSILDMELSLFPNKQVYLLMGDVAIQAINSIARRHRESRVIPSGSTYKIRNEQFYFRGSRAFPSYLQAGPSFNIEKSKRRMIAEDISSALALISPARI
jgi:uracil-DNA glycosylase